MPPADSGADTFGAEQFAALAGVSRETLARLKLYTAMLEDWNARHNLVSRASLPDLWRRHMWDSAQLASLIPEHARTLVDLGSGAGFPGLVLAEILKDRPGFSAVLYESTLKKARFLKAVAKQLNLPAEIRPTRIEQASPQSFGVVTARACAPLSRLLAYAQRFWSEGTVGLFPKGQNVEAELTEAYKSWRISVRSNPSRSDPTGVILEVRELQRVGQ